MSVELKPTPSWERVSRTEFIRTKTGPDGAKQKTLWSFCFDEANLLGFGQESHILLLQTKDALCTPKAIKVNHSHEPHLSREFQTISKIQSVLGRRSPGIHLSTNAYFKRGHLPSSMDPQTAKMILEECLIMRKYEMTLDRALPSLSKNERLEAMLQISKGLADLHGMGIAHRDVHLNNMMYDTRRNAWYLIDVTSPLTSKETEEDDIRYLMMCITEEVLKDDSILIAELKGLSHPLASDIYQILIRHSR